MTSTIHSIQDIKNQSTRIVIILITHRLWLRFFTSILSYLTTVKESFQLLLGLMRFISRRFQSRNSRCQGDKRTSVLTTRIIRRNIMNNSIGSPSYLSTSFDWIRRTLSSTIRPSPRLTFVIIYRLFFSTSE